MMRAHSFFGMVISALVLGACGGQETPATSTAIPAPQQEAATNTQAPAQAQALAQPQAQASTEAVEKEPSPEFASLPAPYIEADYARGKRVWRQCSSCHTVAKDGGHLVGPNLYNVFGRATGGAEGFNYSKALKDAGFDWTTEQMDAYIKSPRSFIPGNRMSFAGVRKPQDRINVIAYLMVESGWSAD